ncbi:pyridine nucleotide-disulfide oxidoreductase [Pusillimonas sp. T2]|uniref:NAD(P)/FAD-dependent oxidoreductase n=1 Tax=Pusillimonas sp. T2 TaxID=1548123 RepID=UPI000B9CA615|nr:FAD-dependent oxidoreductase [Pusillimonas sp. T2]OXR47963.1 pyridine nucleotide-disulfide oxidoreductase [Pusillimonas sp. T2]
MESQAAEQGRVVIVGAGQAGIVVAESLRGGGYAGQIVIMCDEGVAPYHRPPLSKAWLAGELARGQLLMRSPEAFQRKGIDLRIGVKVVDINAVSRQVEMADGNTLAYDILVIATGASPRVLNLPGVKAQGVHVLRSIDDAESIADSLGFCATHDLPVVVIGGGFIGLEVASTARMKGLRVTVLEAASRLLGRVLAPVLSDWYADLHRSHGVSLMLGARPKSIDIGAEGRVQAVTLEDGSQVLAGMVVLGVGVIANDGLAKAAGLTCDAGIVVDDAGRTSYSGIYAAGDCTVRYLSDGTPLRLESVQGATEQARCVASTVLGKPREVACAPWFWSDQYDKKLQIAGLSHGANRWVVHGDMFEESFSVEHYCDDQLLAIDTINSAKEHLAARKRLEAELQNR